MAQNKEKGSVKKKTPVNKESKLTTVYLVGSLGRAMGREKWELDVFSIPEALRAIDINTRGKLSAYLRGPARDKGYRIALQKRENVIDKEEAKIIRSGRSTIYIMPTIAGKKSGIGKIIAGIALIVLTIYTGGLAAGASGWAGVGAGAAAAGGGVTAAATLSALGTIAIGFGVSLVLGGITQLLTPTPKGPTTDSTEQKNSTSFQGNIAAVVQGGCVPVVYGRALVSPIPVSITVDNDDLSAKLEDQGEPIEPTDLNGGFIQYN